MTITIVNNLTQSSARAYSPHPFLFLPIYYKRQYEDKRACVRTVRSEGYVLFRLKKVEKKIRELDWIGLDWMYGCTEKLEKYK
jgi:hypothetical protein